MTPGGAGGPGAPGGSRDGAELGARCRVWAPLLVARPRAGPSRPRPGASPRPLTSAPGAPTGRRPEGADTAWPGRQPGRGGAGSTVLEQTPGLPRAPPGPGEGVKRRGCPM